VSIDSHGSCQVYEELYAFMKWCLLRSCNFNTLGVTWLAKGSSFLINHSSEYVSASTDSWADILFFTSES
jgi:hypothetical protein